MNDESYFSVAIRNELDRRMRKNRSYSLRAFANAIKVSPGSLSLILSGKRVPSATLTKKLVNVLDLAPSERSRFIASIAEAHKNRNLSRKSPFFSTVPEASQTELSRPQEIALQLFQVVSDWYHYAIMMLMETENSQSEPKWIAKQLGITSLEASLALRRLLNIGLLKRKGDRLTVDASYLTTADKNVTNSALRKHQKQILEKAIFSLENDPIEVRSMNSLTMAIDPSRIPKAKEMIEEFNQKLCAYLEGGKRTQVYELGVYLFPIQKKGEG